MRTLDEVIKALEICKNPDINRSCKDCPMPDNQMCIEDLMTDALDYLETWKMIVESERKAHKADVPANPPLTWDELKGMEGKPVWVEHKIFKGWRLVGWQADNDMMNLVGPYSENVPLFSDDCGQTWKAYRKERYEDA